MRVMVMVLGVASLGYGQRVQAQTFLSETSTHPIDLAVYESFDGPLWTPGATDESESARLAVKNHIQSHATSYGLSSSDDMLDLVNGTAFQEVIDGDETPPGFASQSISNYAIEQTIGNIAIDEGRLAAGFFGERLTIVVGRVLGRPYVESLLGGVLTAPLGTYDDARAALKNSGACTAVETFGPTVPHVSLADKRIYFRFVCDDDTVLVDASSFELFSRFPHAAAWAQHPTGVRMKAARDGDKLSSDHNWWMRSGAVAAGDEQLFTGIRTSYENVSGGTCRFGTSVGSDGLSSYIPFPYTRPILSVTHFERQGTCTDGGAAFDFVASQTDFQFANVHTQAERTAHIARRDIWAGLFANFRGPDQDHLYISVGFGGSPCGSGNDGSYRTWDNKICISASTYKAYWWTVPHEYGHYIADTYDLQAGLFDNDERTAVVEGVADALALSIVHRRHFLQASYLPIELTALFLNDPGLVRNLAWANTSMNTHHDVDLRRHLRLGQVGGFATTYEKGMGLSQLMWKFANDRRCENIASCANPVVISQNVNVSAGVPLNIPMYARRAFTQAMIHDAASRDVMTFARAWKWWFRTMVRGLGVPANSPALTQINETFTQQGVP